jgi:hypothetical protein
VEKHLGYPQPPRYNPAAFQKIPPFIRFDLPFARDKNTDMALVGNGDFSNIPEVDQEDETIPIDNPRAGAAEEEIPRIDVNIDIDFSDLTSEERQDQPQDSPELFNNVLNFFLDVDGDMKRMHALVPILEKSKELLKHIKEAETEQRRLHRSTTVRACPPGAQYL